MTVGIDLGTCFSSIGYGAPDGSVVLIPNPFGNRITPSVVAISREEILIGENALNSKDDDSFVVIEKSKTFMASNHKWTTPQGNYTPEDLAFLILNYLKQYAEEFLGTTVDKAVVTVPAYFNTHQRLLTKTAAEKAGMEVIRILSEPTAASLNYKEITNGENILVYDLGGGTFDCTVLQMYDSLARVISTSGDTHLGGQDFDLSLAKSLIPMFDKLNHNEKINALEMCELAKKQLSTRDVVTLNLSKINKSLSVYNLNLSEFNSTTSHLIEKTKICIYNALKDAELEPCEK